MIEENLQKQVIAILEPYRPQRIGVFGSFARGKNNPNSDLDILIQFKDSIGLLELVQIEQELSDKLGVKVDLVTEGSLKNPRLRQYIYDDLITIFE